MYTHTQNTENRVSSHDQNYNGDPDPLPFPLLPHYSLIINHPFPVSQSSHPSRRLLVPPNTRYQSSFPSSFTSPHFLNKTSFIPDSPRFPSLLPSYIKRLYRMSTFFSFLYGYTDIRTYGCRNIRYGYVMTTLTCINGNDHTVRRLDIPSNRKGRPSEDSECWEWDWEGRYGRGRGGGCKW